MAEPRKHSTKDCRIILISAKKFLLLNFFEQELVPNVYLLLELNTQNEKNESKSKVKRISKVSFISREHCAASLKPASTIPPL